ncbi:MAG: CD225/dispanin family protein [Flavobacterium sp.]
MEFNQFENQPQEMREKPNNYMGLSITATVLGMCSIWCIGLVLGIIAIVMSSQSTSKYNTGDYDAAVKSAKNAKMLALIALGLFVVTIIYTVYTIMTAGGMDAYIQNIMDQVKAAQGM